MLHDCGAHSSSATFTNHDLPVQAEKLTKNRDILSGRWQLAVHTNLSPLFGHVRSRTISFGTNHPMATERYNNVALVFVCEVSCQGKWTDAKMAYGLRCLKPIRFDQRDWPAVRPVSRSSRINQHLRSLDGLPTNRQNVSVFAVASEC